jgi:hypothetical protein
MIDFLITAVKTSNTIFLKLKYFVENKVDLLIDTVKPSGSKRLFPPRTVHGRNVG